MTLEEAKEILKRHNKWRKGADTEMENPTKLGIAIDVVLNELNKPKTEKLVLSESQKTKLIWQIFAEIDSMEINGTIDKKELITKLCGRYDYFIMKSFDVHFYNAKKKTSKKFLTENSIITRIE